MNYPHRATVFQAVPGPPDRLNVRHPVWIAVRHDAECHIQRERAREVATAAGKMVVVDHIVLAPIDPPWDEGYRLEVAGLGTFELFDVDPDVAARRHHSETIAATATGSA